MELLDLPKDIIVMLPQYLHSLDDHYALIRTCKAVYDACSNSKAKLPPRFAKRHGQSLFPPHPHLLVAGTVRQVADWAVSDDDNRDRLVEALKGGIEGLYDLAVDVARMSLDDARELHRVKRELFDPVVREIDLEAGRGDSEDVKVNKDEKDDEKDVEEVVRTVPDYATWWTGLDYPELTLLNHWIYCELFHHTIDKAYDPASVAAVQPLSLGTRVTFLSYCVPDCNNRLVNVPLEIFDQIDAYAHSLWKAAHPTRLPLCFMKIQSCLYLDSYFSVGGIALTLWDEDPHEDEARNLETLKGTRERFIYEIILHQPLLTMRLVLPGGVAATRDAIEVIRQKVSDGRTFEAWAIARENRNSGDDDAGRMDGIMNGSSWAWESMNRDCTQIIYAR